MADREQCCPKCKGTTGYRYNLLIKHGMYALGWSAQDEPESDGSSDRTRGGGISLFECLDCGAKMREATVLKIRGVES